MYLLQFAQHVIRQISPSRVGKLQAVGKSQGILIFLKIFPVGIKPWQPSIKSSHNLSSCLYRSMNTWMLLLLPIPLSFQPRLMLICCSAE